LGLPGRTAATDDATNDYDFLVLPGLGNSGLDPEKWEPVFEKEHAQAKMLNGHDDST